MRRVAATRMRGSVPKRTKRPNYVQGMCNETQSLGEWLTIWCSYISECEIAAYFTDL